MKKLLRKQTPDDFQAGTEIHTPKESTSNVKKKKHKKKEKKKRKGSDSDKGRSPPSHRPFLYLVADLLI